MKEWVEPKRRCERRPLHNVRYVVHGGGGGSRMQVLSRAADAAQFESPNEMIPFHWGKCTRAPSHHYSLLLFPSPPTPTSFSPSLPPIAPHRIQFCSFIPTSSPARSLLFISRPPISSPHLSLLFQRSLAPTSPPTLLRV